MAGRLQLFLGLLLSVGVAAQNNQCSTYKNLGRDNERSKDNTVLTADVSNIPCDNLDDDWYRFDTGEIATSCVPIDHCGTSSPIWMKDPVPNVGETRVNEFCVNHKTASNPNSCCLYTFNVTVTNCDGFLVYYFRKDNILCPSGYCKGDLQPCARGKISPTGFEPCPDAAPVMHSAPTLGHPVIISNGQDFTQTCNILNNGSDSDTAYKVTWLFSGVPYKTETLMNVTNSSYVTSADWRGHLGEKLSCMVEAYFVSKGPGYHSSRLTSNEYFGGIQVTPANETIQEGQTRIVTVQSTLPIVCSAVSMDKCRLDLDMTITNGIPNGILASGGCSVTLWPNAWDSVNNMAKVNVELSALVDPVFKPKEVYDIVFHIREDNLGHIFGNYTTNSIQVTATDEPHHMCLMIGNSQILGFKLNTYYVIGDFTGDFLMYKETDSHGKTIQVQTRNWKPYGVLASVCAVAFQYGDVLIKVDLCTNHPDKTAPVITQGGSNPDDVQVYLCDSDYEVITADGVRLSVAIRSHHLDVKLHLPPTFSPNGEGACGHNLHQHFFSKTEYHLYSLSHNESLFEKAAESFYTATSSSAKNCPHYCQCGNTNRACDTFQLINDNGAPIFIDRAGQVRVKEACRVVVPHALNPEVVPWELVPITPHRHDSKPLQQLRNLCSSEIRKHSSHSCIQEFGNTELGVFANICAEDFRYTGGREYLISAVQGFQWWCQEHLLSQLNKYIRDHNNHLHPPIAVTTEMCYGMCSLAGICLRGRCACNPGLSGAECTAHAANPPTILDIKGGHYCELSSLSCGNPILVVRNVYASDQLQVEINAKKFVPGNNHSVTYTMDAVFENLFSVSVPMTQTIGSLNDQTAMIFNIRLTTDGMLYSKPFTYIVYDDKCQFCRVTDGCLQKEDTCHIDGRCYFLNEHNPQNSSQICDPEKAMLKWTEGGNDSQGVSNTQNPPVVGK